MAATRIISLTCDVCENAIYESSVDTAKDARTQAKQHGWTYVAGKDICDDTDCVTAAKSERAESRLYTNTGANAKACKGLVNCDVAARRAGTPTGAHCSYCYGVR